MGLHLLLACSEEQARIHAPVLASEGWDVVVAHDVPTALMQAHRQGPDVVVVAGRLPGGHGTTLVTRLQHLAATSLTPVVGLADDPNVDQELCAAGASRCLAAATTPEELAAVVRALARQASTTSPPVAHPDRPAGPATAGAVSEPSAVGGPGTGGVNGRVVVVEDDASVRGLLTETIELDGHAVAGFERAGEALEAAVAQPPDVVLVDVRLPDMSGLELLDRLRAAEATWDVPVLLISGLDDDMAVDGLRRGAQDYIRKPFDIDEVLARVASAVEGKQAHDRLRVHVDELEHRSLSDRLTGLPNRRSAEQNLERFAAQAARMGGELSALMVEIDDLADLVARHDRVAVDEMVAALASRLAATCRTADVLTRWSERLFLVLLPWTGAQGSLRAAARLRAAVDDSGVRRPDGRCVTVSVGAATLDLDTRQLLVDAEVALRRTAGPNGADPGAGRHLRPHLDEA